MVEWFYYRQAQGPGVACGEAKFEKFFLEKNQ